MGHNQELVPKRVGKLEIESYDALPSTPSGSSKKPSPPKKTQTYIDFNNDGKLSMLLDYYKSVNMFFGSSCL